MKNTKFMLLACAFSVVPMFSSVYAADSKETTEAVEESEEESTEEDSDNGDPFSFEDFEWTEKLGVWYDERAYISQYTNNTEYDILRFDVSYVKKDDVTDDDMIEAYSKLLTDNGGYLSEDSILLYDSLMAEHPEYVAAGEESNVEGVCIYGSESITSEEQRALYEPDIATIEYVDGDKIRTASYDFINATITFDSKKAVDAHEWSDSDLAKLISEPEYDIVQVWRDDNEKFNFAIYNVTMDDFTSLKQIFIDAGFDNVGSESSWRYDALNDDGIEVDFSIVEDYKYISCWIVASEK